jgi:DNA-binding GntR family transcriptional regulator
MLKLKTIDIGRTASAADLILESLREAIVHGEMQDGEVLRQDQIASLFNVSRIPVREALARLEALGLVTSHRYKGAVVASLSLDEIAETFEFRALIEPEVLRLAVANMSGKSLDEASRNREAFATEADPEQWAQLNRAFHYALYRDANRPYHLQIVSSALDKVGRYLKAQLALTDGMEQARLEHAAILDACLARDGDRAAELTRRHILDASHSLIAFLKRERGEQG